MEFKNNVSYALRAGTKVHTSDTKFVASHSDSMIMSASRDQTCCVSLLSDTDELLVEKSLIGHRAFVNFILYHPKLPLLQNKDCFISGSNDNHIIIWSVSSCSIEAVLDGHSNGVSCGTILENIPSSLNAGKCNGDIVTGDWSGMCIVFDGSSGKAKQTYTKHSVAIRSITQLPGTELIVSGSGDKTAHVWNSLSGETVQICNHHIDVVQCVCAIQSNVFATGSNDCSIAIWQVGVEAPLRILQGHTSLVYGLSWNQAMNQLLSCSEDRSVIIWGDHSGSSEAFSSFDTVQVVVHPTLVWSVSALPCGDFLTGTADGFIRVWTQNEDRVASAPKIVELHDAIAAQRIDSRTTPAELLTGSFPSVQDLHKYPGKEGERRMFKSDTGEVELYIMSGGSWEKVGVVVAGPDQSPITGGPLPKEKKFYKGKEYDYLFDVEIGGKMLKLPYNAGESVISVARNFISDHPELLSIDNFEPVRDFLIQNISEEDRQLIAGRQPTSQKAEIVPWEFISDFAAFNGSGAQKKINELLGADNQKYHNIVDRVQQHKEDCVDHIVELLAVLPVTLRFPALDLLRYHVHSCRTLPSKSIATAVNRVTQVMGHGGAEGGGEHTVLLRWISIVIEWIYLHQQSVKGTANDMGGDYVALMQILEGVVELLQERAIFSVEHAPSTALQNACISILCNASLLIREMLKPNDLPPQMAHQNEGQVPPATAVLDTMAKEILFFSLSGGLEKLTYPVLTTILTLYDTHNNIPIRQLPEATQLGKALLPILQKMALESDDSEIRRICVLLLPLL